MADDQVKPNEAEEAAVPPADEPAAEAPAEEGKADTEEAAEPDLEAKCAEYKQGWQRAMADYDNLKKDLERLRTESAKYGCVGLVSELMPAVEALRKAVEHEPATDGLPEEVKKWLEGMVAIRQQLENALTKSGIEFIAQTKVAFDPNLHEALMTREEEGMDADQVVEVVETGYRLHDRVIKPAKVIVSK
jgi:molecular chaperone GrpE